MNKCNQHNSRKYDEGVWADREKEVVNDWLESNGKRNVRALLGIEMTDEEAEKSWELLKESGLLHIESGFKDKQTGEKFGVATVPYKSLNL